jgi:hypothetical protein
MSRRSQTSSPIRCNVPEQPGQIVLVTSTTVRCTGSAHAIWSAPPNVSVVAGGPRRRTIANCSSTYTRPTPRSTSATEQAQNYPASGRFCVAAGRLALLR